MRRVFYRIAPIVLMIMTLITARPLKASAVSGVPTIISYQGRLTDSAGMLLGGVGTPYYFKFSIWTTATVGGGTKLWPSGTPGTMTITVTDGVFNAAIGDTGNGYPDALTYNFEDSDTVYLQIEVSPNGSVFETLGPRQRITSASTAINAKTLQGLLPGTGANNLLTLGASGEIALVSGGISTLGNVSLGTVSAGTWNGGLIGDVYLTKTGNWTGTFDGQEGSYYLNAANLINFSTPFATAFGTKTTDDLAEGSTNLYFTSTNFNTAFSGKNISLLNNDAGYITASSVPVLSVNGNIGDVVLTTSDLAEGLGLYFTDKRAQDSVGTILSGEFTYADTVPLISIASIASSKITGTKTSSYISDFNSSVQTVGDARYPEFTGSYNNPAWIASLAYSKLAGAPSNLSDFTNDAGYINSITSFDTDDLIEGSNLYFTDERAQDVIGSMLSGEFTYTDGTPLLEINSIAATKITGTKTSAFISDFSSAAQSALAGLYELPLTISTGLTRTSDTITNNLSIGVSGGQSVIGGTASGNNLTLSSTSNGTKGKIIFGSASAYDEASDRLGIGTVSPGYKLTVSTTTANDQTIRAVNSATTGTNYGGVFISNGSGATQNTGGYFTASGATTNYAVYSDGQANIVGGTLLTNGTNNALNITATEPSGTLGGHSYGAKVVVTSAGTTAEGWVRGAMFTQLAAGYTGAGTTVGAYFANTAAGTGTDPFVAGTYNAGFYGYTGSTTTGTNIGAKGAADGGSVNYGGFYQAVTAKNSATNIGILAQALNTGTSPVQVAGYFGLQATAPTYTSAALIADNGSTTSPIFLARDNGTAVFSIIDGGNVGIAMTPTYRLDVTGDAADTTVMRISTTSGNACTFSTITGSFSCASDSRLKHDIASIDATDALTKLSALNPVLYRYNWQTSSDPLIAGFVAQEFESIFPDLVKTDPITGYKSLSYAPLMPYVISAIQDMNLKVAKLPIYQDQTMMDRLSAFWDGIATSGHAVVEKMTTHELCVDDVCVTRDQFLHMVQQSGQASTTPAPTPNAEAPDPVVEETPAQPEAVVETPLEEPAPVVEATP